MVPIQRLWVECRVFLSHAGGPRLQNLLLVIVQSAIEWPFLYNSLTFQKSVPGAQVFLSFIIWISDEKIILFSLAYGRTNRRPIKILLCCGRPLLTFWICYTYWLEVGYKIERIPCKIRSSFLDASSSFYLGKKYFLFVNHYNSPFFLFPIYSAIIKHLFV